MAHYYFDSVYDRAELVRDEDGTGMRQPGRCGVYGGRTAAEVGNRTAGEGGCESTSSSW